MVVSRYILKKKGRWVQDIYKMRGVLVILLISVFSTSLWAEKTTRKRLKPKEDVVETIVEKCDTVAPDTTKIMIAGYDKPHTSRRETFFVTNGYDRDIVAIDIKLVYYDMSGRQLHAVQRVVECDIPAGETRQVDIPSWDKQFGFYYYQSPRPRRQATPFKVKHRLHSITLAK